MGAQIAKGIFGSECSIACNLSKSNIQFASHIVEARLMRSDKTSRRLELLARELESSGEYRVLRKLKPPRNFPRPPSKDIRIGIVLDIETTGINTENDEVIELAMIRFEYTLSGDVCGVQEVYSALNEPSGGISDEIEKLTGIGPSMVAGSKIQSNDVLSFIDQAALVIAHNANFDRRICERYWPEFSQKPWACSATEIDWKKEGFESSRLGSILSGYGLFHEGHRALQDCDALLEILTRPLSSANAPVLSALLTSARRSVVRLWALDAPYNRKDDLKNRGYRWSDGKSSPHRAWWKDFAESEIKNETDFLISQIYKKPISLPTKIIAAVDRYSVREDT